MRIIDYIIEHAHSHPQHVAVVCEGQEANYGELWQCIQKKADQLVQDGLVANQPYVFRSSQSIDFIVTYFAVHCIGAVAVPLERDIPDKMLCEIEQRVKRAQIAPNTADILFTTGTTGLSKGVMVSHQAIMANTDNLIQGQGFCSDLLFIISGPLNHIGSLSKVFPIMQLGATLYITEGMKDIDGFFRAMDYSTTRIATFLVPANIRILLQFCSKRLAEYAKKIDFIETGASAIAQNDMETLCQILPYTRLYNTYASTETGIICTHDYNHSLRQAGCLGRPMPHSRIFITDNGLLACQGETLMSGYIDDETMTQQMLHDNTVFTNDRGHIDEEGRLHLLGRIDDIINMGGYKINPQEVESVAMTFPSLVDCICTTCHHPILGTILRLLVVLREEETLNKRHLALHLASQLERYKVPQVYEQVSSIRRTYNGKLDRKYYNNSNI